jgi:hypothetical protein
MARMPAAAAATPPMPLTPSAGAGGAGALAGLTPPAGGAPGSDAGGDAGGDDDSSNVLVTIVKNDDGSYMVYAGDEPDGGGADMSGDDATALGSGGDATAPQGTPADSVGAALKAALDILNADKSSEGAPGNADDQLSAGFNADQTPTPSTGAGPKGP